MPNVFIPVAEKQGSLQHSVNGQSMRLAQISGAGSTPVLHRARLPSTSRLDNSQDRSSSKVARFSIATTSPRLLELEITESVFMRDPATSAGTLRECEIWVLSVRSTISGPVSRD